MGASYVPCPSRGTDFGFGFDDSEKESLHPLTLNSQQPNAACVEQRGAR